MQQNLWSIAPLLIWVCSVPLVHSKDHGETARNSLCNQDGTLCVKASLEQSVIQNPFYFDVQVRCPEQIVLDCELRDDSGKVLDKDPRGSLVFPVSKVSGSERILGVRDFAVSPAGTNGWKLLLHAATYSITGKNHALPELSVPVELDRRTIQVTYAVPAREKEFSQAVINAVESERAHRVPMQAEVD